MQKFSYLVQYLYQANDSVGLSNFDKDWYESPDN